MPARGLKPHERRGLNAYPYFKLSTWDDRSMTYRAGVRTYCTESLARAEAKRAGRYRVCVVRESGEKIDGESFEIF